MVTFKPAKGTNEKTPRENQCYFILILLEMEQTPCREMRYSGGNGGGSLSISFYPTNLLYASESLTSRLLSIVLSESKLLNKHVILVYYINVNCNNILTLFYLYVWKKSNTILKKVIRKLVWIRDVNKSSI